jgi:hypothetical protein
MQRLLIESGKTEKTKGLKAQEEKANTKWNLE